MSARVVTEAEEDDRRGAFEIPRAAHRGGFSLVHHPRMASYPTFAAWVAELRALLTDAPDGWVDEHMDVLHHMAVHGWTPARVANLVLDPGPRGEMGRKLLSTLRDISEVADLQRLYGIGDEPEPPKH